MFSLLIGPVTNPKFLLSKQASIPKSRFFITYSELIEFSSPLEISGHLAISRSAIFSLTLSRLVNDFISNAYSNSLALESKSDLSPRQTTFAFKDLKKSS